MKLTVKAWGLCEDMGVDVDVWMWMGGWMGVVVSGFVGVGVDVDICLQEHYSQAYLFRVISGEEGTQRG